MASSLFRLIVRTGPNPGMVFELTKEVTLFGRDVTSDIVLGDTEVSRQHARITHTAGGYVMEDLGSTNGTFVNGERLMAPRVLNPGDLIGFGEGVTLTFDAVSPDAAATIASPVAAPPPTPAPQAPVAAPVAHVATPTPATPAERPARRSCLPLALAGGGCLVLIIACGAVLWFMDANYPDILYAPLRVLGFY